MGQQATIPEKLKVQQFNLSQKPKALFPCTQDLQGLFSIVNRLYGIQIVEREALFGTQMHVILNSKIKVQWSVDSADLYARQGQTWWRMDEWFPLAPKTTHGHLQKPICYMVCNFYATCGDQAALADA